jgi:hypothetical protein
VKRILILIYFLKLILFGGVILQNPQIGGKPLSTSNEFPMQTVEQQPGDVEVSTGECKRNIKICNISEGASY